MGKAFILLLAIVGGTLGTGNGYSQGGSLPPNQWIQIEQDQAGARRGSAVRYVPDEGAFFLWGFMNADYDLLQEQPLIRIPEYDMVYFKPDSGKWQNHFPGAWEEKWKEELPLAYVPRTYAGITTGGERTILRSPTDSPYAAPRPDLNIVFDQVTYDSHLKSLIYFTGGLTAAYDPSQRHWADLTPPESPPPVLGGSLVYIPTRKEVLLCGGGHVAERSADGDPVGYTGCWILDAQNRTWQRLDTEQLPPPRMNTRMVYDSSRDVVVLFGGDGQSHFLGDTWIYEPQKLRWRQSTAELGPPPRAGHFTVYDPETGFVIIGGGYNTDDLTDMWAYDVATDSWKRLPGDVPTGFYITADIAPEKRLILLLTNTRRSGDRKGCDPLFPVRTTYAYRIENAVFQEHSGAVSGQPSLAKIEEAQQQKELNASQQKLHVNRLTSLPANQWMELLRTDSEAPLRTWGSATYDSDRSQILYWGGGHCGYGGNDTDAYLVKENRWKNFRLPPEFPERLWNSGNGSRLAGLTFTGRPWVIHGRKIYAYDPVSHKMILVRPIRLTSGYNPEILENFPDRRVPFRDALVQPPSSYVRYATWTFDPDSGDWSLLGPAPVGLDLLVSTPEGVMGIDTNWRTRLNDAGYNLPWNPMEPPRSNNVYRLRASTGEWERVGGGLPSPQNLYEMTSLVYDSTRDRLILHGGGKHRNEVWAFDIASGTWSNLRPEVSGSSALTAPSSTREAVYLPEDDLLLTFGSREEGSPLWAFSVEENLWRRLSKFPDAPAIQSAGQNRAMVYDSEKGIILVVLGLRGDAGGTAVYAFRFDNGRQPGTGGD